MSSKCGSSTSTGAISKTPSHKKKEEKKSTEGRKYAQIPKESIMLYAETILDRIGDDIAKPMAEDVSYRLREIIHVKFLHGRPVVGCSTFLAQANRSCLNPDDVNQVLESMDVQPVFGHSGGGAVGFSCVRETSIYTEDDPEVDLVELALTNSSISQKGNHFIKSMWLLPKKSTEEAPEPGPSTATTADNSNSTVPLPISLVSYYKYAYRVIFGNSKRLFEILTEDFRTSIKVGTVLPYIIEAIATALQDADRNGQRILWLLNATDALADNEAVDLSPALSVNQLVSGLLLCALDFKVRKGNFISADEDIRQKSAFILSKVLRRWCGSVVVQEVLRKISAMLQDFSTPLQMHRGALHVLTAMGRAFLALCLWPLLLPPGHYSAFLDVVQTVPDVIIDFEAIKDIILTAAKSLYKTEAPDDEEGAGENLRQHRRTKAEEEHEKLTREVQRLLYAQFGDTVCCRWPLPAYTPLATKPRPPVPEIGHGRPFPMARTFSPRHQSSKVTNGQPAVSLAQMFEQASPSLLSPVKQALPSTDSTDSIFSLDSSSLVLRQCKARNKQADGHQTFTTHSPYQKACSNVLWIGKMHKPRFCAFEMSGNLRSII